MATFNLVRNSRVFFTTNVDASTGVIPSSGATITPTNTFELQVMDGYSFTQGTQQATIQISEAGNTPTRGQRAFNTQLDPVDFSFSTYIRPELNSGLIRSEEQVLWNALLSAMPIDTTNTATLTTTALTRASTTTNAATLTHSAFNFTTVGASPGIAVGDVVSLGGLTSGVTNASQWTGPVEITAFSPSATACTSLSFKYLVAPSAAAGATCVTAPTAATIRRGALAQQVSSVSSPAYSQLHTGGSNKNQLQKFGMYFVVDNQMYAVDNCALDQATIDFGLDGIAMVAWSGKGTALRQLASTAVISTANPAVFSGAGNATGTASTKVTTAPYITNKLSTMKLIAGIQGSGTSYNIALTGGSITIANNINYVIPNNLGVVNTAIGYFTGTRSISGTVTAYLRTGANNSAQVLNDILSANLAETKFRTQIEIGGASNSVHVDVNMNGTVLQVPTVETADVMSTTVNFTAQGYDPLLATDAYDLEQTNDMTVTYYSV